MTEQEILTAIRAEIERRKELLKNGDAHPEVLKRVEGALNAYGSILSFLDTLEEDRKDKKEKINYHLLYADLIKKFEPYKDREVGFDGYDERDHTEVIFYIGDEAFLKLSRKWGKDDIETSDGL